MNLDYYFEKAVTSFNGDWFYLAYFNGEIYLTDTGREFFVYSKKPIVENSVYDDDCFITRFKIEDFEDVTRAKLFIKYKGNEYEALNVRVGFSEVIIKARKGLESEDLKLGFMENVYERMAWKTITKEEIEDIRIEEVSVYDKFLEKYGNK